MSDHSESDPATTWGRVGDDGTIYVRTADGERAVGSWRAGSASEGLAHFERRYADLCAEVELLEQRVTLAAADPSGISGTARRLLDTLDEATVVGDLDAVRRRLGAVLGATEQRRLVLAAERAERSARVAAAKEVLVAEAEQLGRSSEWKVAGERFRTLAEEFRAAGSLDKRTDSALWRRITAAREEFTHRRTTHFAALDTQRARSRERKEAIIAEARALVDSSDWAGTTARYRGLLGEWKSAGRATKDVDDALWAEFRQVQDVFFRRRNDANAERDAEMLENQVKKEALLAEASALDPADLDRALRRLRELQDRWDEIGRTPRESAGSLERQMAAVGDRLRDAADERWERQSVSSSPFVTRLRESVAKLEAKLARAQAAGRAKEIAETEAALATQRAWLAQAES